MLLFVYSAFPFCNSESLLWRTVGISKPVLTGERGPEAWLIAASKPHQGLMTFRSHGPEQPGPRPAQAGQLWQHVSSVGWGCGGYLLVLVLGLSCSPAGSCALAAAGEQGVAVAMQVQLPVPHRQRQISPALQATSRGLTGQI